MRLVDPKYYPISNLEKYENPEIYKKSKKYRQMQPQFSSKLLANAKNTPDNGEKKEIDEKDDEIDENFFQTKKSPSTSIISNSTQKNTIPTIQSTKIAGSDVDVNKSNVGSVKKSLFQPAELTSNSVDAHCLNTSLSSEIFKEAPITPIQTLRKSTRYSTSIYATPSLKISNKTPKPSTNRRKTIQTPLNVSPPTVFNTPPPVIEKNNKTTLDSAKSATSQVRRETIYTPYLMEETLARGETNLKNSETISSPHPMDLCLQTPNPHEEKQKNNRRRTTLYTPNDLIVQEKSNFLVRPQLIGDEANAQMLLIPQSLPSVKNNRRRTVFDLSTSSRTGHLFGNKTPSQPESSQTEISSSLSSSNTSASIKEFSIQKPELSNSSQLPVNSLAKKRLLFNPTSLFGDIPDESSMSLKSPPNLTVKRPRDSPTKTKTAIVPESKVKIIKSIEPSPIKNIKPPQTPHFSRRTTHDFSMNVKQLQKTPMKYKPTIQFMATPSQDKPKAFMAITNMHQEQTDIIKEVGKN